MPPKPSRKRKSYHPLTAVEAAEIKQRLAHGRASRHADDQGPGRTEREARFETQNPDIRAAMELAIARRQNDDRPNTVSNIRPRLALHTQADTTGSRSPGSNLPVSIGRPQDWGTDANGNTTVRVHNLGHFPAFGVVVEFFALPVQSTRKVGNLVLLGRTLVPCVPALNSAWATAPPANLASISTTMGGGMFFWVEPDASPRPKPTGFAGVGVTTPPQRLKRNRVIRICRAWSLHDPLASGIDPNDRHVAQAEYGWDARYQATHPHGATSPNGTPANVIVLNVQEQPQGQLNLELHLTPTLATPEAQRYTAKFAGLRASDRLAFPATLNRRQYAFTLDLTGPGTVKGQIKVDSNAPQPIAFKPY